MFASHPDQIDVSISDRSQKFVDEINLYASKNTIASAKQFQKQIEAKFVLSSILSISVKGVVTFHDGRLLTWNGSNSFYELEDMKQDPTGSKEALEPFTLLETTTALTPPTKQTVQETLARLKK